MNDFSALDVLRAVSDLFDPDGEHQEPYAYFVGLEEEALLAGILDAYNEEKPDPLLAHLVLAALHAAPEGTPLTYTCGDLTRSGHTSLGSLEFANHWDAMPFFSIIDSGAKLTFNLKERM